MAGQLDELVREVESLRAEVEEARARARHLESSLAELDEQRAETGDRLQLAARQVEDLGHQLERRQRDLEEAREQARYEAFLELVNQRDAAAREAAAQLSAALAVLADLQSRRDEVAAALAGVPGRFEAIVPAEPQELEEAWTRVVALVRAGVSADLEDDLVEAAARSFGGRAIRQLPLHLQELAAQRRRELHRESVARERERH